MINSIIVENSKPCPFNCGGKLKLMEVCHNVYIPQCSTKECIAGKDGLYRMGKEDAIKAWETRS